MTESLRKFYVYEAAHNFLMNIIFEASWVPQEQVSRFFSSWLCKKRKFLPALGKSTVRLQQKRINNNSMSRFHSSSSL